MPQLAERNTRYIYAKLAGVRMQQKLGHVKLSSILPSPWSTVRLVSANGSTVSFNGHSDHLEYHTFYSLSIRIEKKWASWSRLGEDTKKEKKRALCPSRFLLHYYSQGFPASVAALWWWWLARITLLVLMNFAENIENIFDGIMNGFNETSSNESSFSQYLSLFWPVWQLRAAVEPNLSLSQTTPISWYT